MRRRQQLAFYATLLFTLAALLWLLFFPPAAGRGSLHHPVTQTLAVISVVPRLVNKINISSSSVSRIVHQSWKTRQLPGKRSERWSASWKTCFPSWEWRLWTDADNLALVRDHYPWFLSIYQSFRYSVERSDIARYLYMLHYGGIYTDLDNICVRNFAHLLQSPALVFGGMDGHNESDYPVLHTYVQNSFMASRPGHQFWLRLLKRIERNYKAGKKGRPEDLTGPNVLMEELREYAKSNATDLTVYPSKYFNPFSWKVNKNPACKDFGRMSDAEEKICIASFPEAYVVQMHAQSWGRGHMR